MKIHLIRTLHDEEEALPDALPVEPEEAAPLRREAARTEPARTEAIQTAWGLFEVLLKAPARLDAFVREPALQGKLIVGFAAIVAVGFALCGLVLSLLLLAAPPDGVPGLLRPGWSGTWRGVAVLTLTYPLGMLLTTLFCLPSYYYFALLGGAKMSLAEVLTHSLKGKAAATVLLLGVLPVYAVVMLGLIQAGAPGEMIAGLSFLGLLMPFFMGIRGGQSIFTGLQASVDALPAKERKRRYTLPGWLVVVWAALFFVTAPLVFWKTWGLLSSL